MNYGPIIRIILRYAAGGIIGAETAEALIADPDVMDMVTTAVAVVVGIVTEFVYAQAVKRGWTK